ncbi:GNAT family N-acetyltransferase [Acidisoma silvae]|uniref:GNAT family N-acetyltransferase n=1 Tax=Acidisoma silvae TaxID=2802396 RepID=A0A964DXF3_9PROT|nr:GNAT family protein [Acidisoma silvae]MCB8873992.1 GNAT family N-acetyltransferase [Acidisoma silvae]
MSLSDWAGVPRPERVTLDGLYARLEPLDPLRHTDELFDAASAPGAAARFRYLFESEPADAAEFSAWVAKAAAGTDPLFFAVIDKATGGAEGRQALMRIDPVHGVIEIGSIHWGPAIQRSRVTTEALYLFARYAFETLGYRRFEWKCNDGNAPSKQAARRFGFTYEGLFRQHMVAKGQNRDTAWFSMIDSEWPALSAAFQAWLDPANFNAAGQQKRRLEDFRAS